MTYVKLWSVLPCKFGTGKYITKTQKKTKERKVMLELFLLENCWKFEFQFGEIGEIIVRWSLTPWVPEQWEGGENTWGEAFVFQNKSKTIQSKGEQYPGSTIVTQLNSNQNSHSYQMAKITSIFLNSDELETQQKKQHMDVKLMPHCRFECVEHPCRFWQCPWTPAQTLY